jgi:Spy/CpxP family protein refolding chaperone
MLSEGIYMKTSRIIGIGIYFIILSLFFSAIAYTQGIGEFRDRGFRGDRERIHQQLNLTSEQETKINALRTEYRKTMIDTRSEIQKIQLNIQNEMRSDNPNMNLIEGLVKNQENLRTTMRLARLTHRNDVASLLTPEQQEIFKQRFTERREFDGRRDGKRPRGSGRR